jgi:hypothetical protein
VRRDLGAILAHGEPETGIGQGESAEAPAVGVHPVVGENHAADASDPTAAGNGAGELVAVDFGGLGPAGPDAA